MSHGPTAKPTEKSTKQTVDPSRRSFLLSTVGAGAVVAGMVAESKAGGGAASIPSITIPKDIPDSLSQSPQPGSFEGQGMSGAEVFAKLCHEEELAALFCCPGNYTVINAIAAAGVPEQAVTSPVARENPSAAAHIEPSQRPP